MSRDKPSGRIKRSERREKRRSAYDGYTPTASIEPKDVPKGAYEPPPRGSGPSDGDSGDK
ncbi:hypothetical protein [Candidatus Poriferisodalis sp.]|uniref:hypothetical protein n=1 Tax=Candidatus Poriferisodalis sp. TaxID=3101277 RepID=UPI003B02B02C